MIENCHNVTCDFRLYFLNAYISDAFYINKIMKDFLKGNSKYKTIGKLIIISAATPNPIISILYMPIIGLMFRKDGEFGAWWVLQYQSDNDVSTCTSNQVF
jgi:hypothetical protein